MEPKLFAAVGNKDIYYEVGQAVIQHLRPNFDFTYYEAEGGHDWIFWDNDFEESD